MGESRVDCEGANLPGAGGAVGSAGFAWRHCRSVCTPVRRMVGAAIGLRRCRERTASLGRTVQDDGGCRHVARAISRRRAGACRPSLWASAGYVGHRGDIHRAHQVTLGNRPMACCFLYKRCEFIRPLGGATVDPPTSSAAIGGAGALLAEIRAAGSAWYLSAFLRSSPPSQPGLSRDSRNAARREQ
jgi:hypothetical protein